MGDVLEFQLVDVSDSYGSPAYTTYHDGRYYGVVFEDVDGFAHGLWAARRYNHADETLMGFRGRNHALSALYKFTDTELQSAPCGHTYEEVVCIDPDGWHLDPLSHYLDVSVQGRFVVFHGSVSVRADLVYATSYVHPCCDNGPRTYVHCQGDSAGGTEVFLTQERVLAALNMALDRLDGTT